MNWKRGAPEDASDGEPATAALRCKRVCDDSAITDYDELATAIMLQQGPALFAHKHEAKREIARLEKKQRIDNTPDKHSAPPKETRAAASKDKHPAKKHAKPQPGKVGEFCWLDFKDCSFK